MLIDDVKAKQEITNRPPIREPFEEKNHTPPCKKGKATVKRLANPRTKNLIQRRVRLSS